MKVGVIRELPLVSHPDCREKAMPFPLWERHPCRDSRFGVLSHNKDRARKGSPIYRGLPHVIEESREKVFYYTGQGNRSYSIRRASLSRWQRVQSSESTLQKNSYQG